MFRQVATDWPPLYHDAGEPAPSQESGRWHRKGEGYAQYFALHPNGAWAELARLRSIRSPELAAEQTRDIWSIYVEQADIADLATFDAYRACGLDPAIAVGPHTDSQVLADDLREAGYTGVLSPSAALPGVTNLTIFGVRYERTLGQQDLATWDNPNPGVWFPCTPIALKAAMPRDLTTLTCFANQPHTGYNEWLAQQ